MLFGGGEPLLKAVVKLREQGMLVRRPCAALRDEFLQGCLIVFLADSLLAVVTTGSRSRSMMGGRSMCMIVWRKCGAS